MGRHVENDERRDAGAPSSKWGRKDLAFPEVPEWLVTDSWIRRLWWLFRLWLLTRSATKFLPISIAIIILGTSHYQCKRVQFLSHSRRPSLSPIPSSPLRARRPSKTSSIDTAMNPTCNILSSLILVLRGSNYPSTLKPQYYHLDSIIDSLNLGAHDDDLFSSGPP